MTHTQLENHFTGQDIERMMEADDGIKTFVNRLPMPTVEMLRCPKCRQEQCFVIEVWSRLMMFKDGVVLHEGDDRTEVWDDDSYCRCPACEHTGQVLEFRSDVQAFLEDLLNDADGKPAK